MTAISHSGVAAPTVSSSRLAAARSGEPGAHRRADREPGQQAALAERGGQPGDHRLRRHRDPGGQRGPPLHGLREHRQQEHGRPGHHRGQRAQAHGQRGHRLPEQRQVERGLRSPRRVPPVRRQQRGPRQKRRQARRRAPAVRSALAGAEQHQGDSGGEHDQASQVEFSLFPGTYAPGSGSGPSRFAAHTATTPSGTLTAKISRQPPAPISAPPTVGPSAGAANSMIPAATEMDRARPPLPSSMDIASGTSGAATSPCTSAERDQRADAGGQRAQRGRRGERRQADPVHRHRPVPPREVRGAGQPGAEPEQVPADRPLHRGERGVQRPRDRLGRHVDDAGVDHGQQRPGQQRVLHNGCRRWCP